MSAILDALLVTAVVTNGLLAGLFFVFACAIAPAFRLVDDGTYVRAFRAINTAILNGWFLCVFFVAPIAAIAGAVLHFWRGDLAPLAWLGLGAACSTLTFLITTAANVPLNRQLDQATVDTEPQCRAARQRFEGRWNRWNLVRTLTSVAALGCFAVTAIT